MIDLNKKNIKLLIKLLINRDFDVIFHMTSIFIISFDQNLLRASFCHVNNFVNITSIEKFLMYNIYSIIRVSKSCDYFLI